MSRFYIEDLERIKSGMEVELTLGSSLKEKKISLSKLNEQIKDLRNIIQMSDKLYK